MKSASAAGALLSICISTVYAAIDLGVATRKDNGIEYQVGWIDGANQCEWTFIANNSDNPCSAGTFKLSNGYSYYEFGCGGDDYSLCNADGTFNSNCNYNVHTYDCGVYTVEQVYKCG